MQSALAQKPNGLSEHAFQTLLRNRVNRGGILAPGAGRVKTGENGKGMASRWYPQTLAKRILGIAGQRDKITFVHGDGLGVMHEYAANPNAVYFIDPPYTAGGKQAGSRLYTHARIDHNALFLAASQLAGDFVMTYDQSDEVLDLAAKYQWVVKRVAMKSTHHAQMTELVIGRDLDWLKD